uniref:Uncharacterized protein n=1 Tax=Solibacter usitatus (strain Ellin6076) TaxID=234267 RepID=Q01RX0_SOLUE
MKPLHIALLIGAGAVGGAVIMKVSQRPPAQLTARVETTPQTPPATAPPPATPAVEPPAASASGEPVHPSPFVAKKEVREAPKPGRVHRVAPQAPQVRPPVVAQNRPAEAIPNTVVVAPQPAETAPAPQPVPPARTEPENVTPPPPVEAAPPEPHRVTLNAGTLIPVRLVDGLSSERNLPGDTFTATLDKELVVDGFVIAERGARVEGRVVASDRGGRVRGVSSLQVQIVRLRLSDGQTIGLQTETFERRADPTHNQDAAKVGGGAALGAIIGAIAGGGKGAAIGAGVGGAAGTADVLATRGKPATLPSETRLTFRLRAAVTVTEKGRA